MDRTEVLLGRRQLRTSSQVLPASATTPTPPAMQSILRTEVLRNGFTFPTSTPQRLRLP